MRAAVWYRARTELRQRWRAVVSLAVLSGLGGGMVIAAAAGARRTDTAYPRFLARTNAADVFMPNTGGVFGFATLDFDVVERLPQVAESARLSYFVANMDLPNGKHLSPVTSGSEIVVFGSDDGRFDTEINAMQVVEGRLADQAREDEITVSYIAAKRYGFRVGDVVTMQFPQASEVFTFDPNFTGPSFSMRVAGIEASAGELPPPSGWPPVHLTAAFHRAHAKDIFHFDALVVRLRDRSLLGAFKTGLESTAILPDPEGRRLAPLTFTIPEHSALVQRSIHLQVIAFWLFAALAGLAALLMLAQAIARQATLDSVDSGVLAAVGLTRAEIFAVAMVRALILAAGGAVIAGGLAFALSPLTPMGLARIAEPDSGFRFDPLAVLVGAGALFVALLAMVAVPSWRAARVRVRHSDALGRARPSRTAGIVARAGVRPTGAAGVRLAMEPGRGANAIAIRSSIFAITIGIASVAAALGVGSSLTHLSETPRLYGWQFDMVVGDNFQPDLSHLLPALQTDERVSELAKGTVIQAQIGAVREDVLAVDPVVGSSTVTILEGRAPRGADEMALGTRTMQTVHARIGDDITVAVGDVRTTRRVVGRAVFPPISETGGLGRGALMTLASAHRLVPEAASNLIFVRFTSSTPRAAIVAFTKRYEQWGITRTVAPSEIVNFGSVDAMPYILAGMLALLALGTLAHILVTSVRRRRRDLAILKTIGFTRGQVRATVAWQATTLSLISLLLGVPCGIAAGRMIWSLIAGGLGVPFEPVSPMLWLVALVPGVLIPAYLIAAAPGEVAARTIPAEVLRTG